MGDLIKITKTTIPCNITGTHDAVVISEKDRHGKPLRTVVNLASGLVYTDPRPSHETVKNFYSEDYRQEYKGSTTPKMKHIRRAGMAALDRWRKLSPYIKKGSKILDAGAGGGELLYLLTKKGHEASGIEANKGYAGYAIDEYALDIRIGCFEDVEFEPETFDVILLFHVLEHLENPVQEIQRLKAFLRVGGIFIIEVPNVTYKRGFPTAKWHIAHLYNFNRMTLAAAAVKAGMDVVNVKEMGHGGHLFGVFTNTDPSECCSLEGNFETVFHALNTHKMLPHLLSHHPYTRPIRKAMESIAEKWAIRNFRSGRELLDKLYDHSC